jgi:cytochrome d ubiquinol oxidase subunit I
LFILLTVWGWLVRDKLTDNRLYLKIMLWAIPLPYIAIEAGWLLTEVGRQPWIVWGVMRTKDAFSPIAASQVWVSLAAFVLVYSLLGLAAYYQIFKHARKGPGPLPEPAKAGEEATHA